MNVWQQLYSLMINKDLMQEFRNTLFLLFDVSVI